MGKTVIAIACINGLGGRNVILAVIPQADLKIIAARRRGAIEVENDDNAVLALRVVDRKRSIRTPPGLVQIRTAAAACRTAIEGCTHSRRRRAGVYLPRIAGRAISPV